MNEAFALLLSALLAGLAGSGHCVAMCGGMAGLLSARRDAAGRPLRRTVVYNAGRVASYTLGGMIAGGAGHAVGIAAGLDVAAIPLRVMSGVIIMVAGLYLLTGRKRFAPFERLGERVWREISPLAVRQLQRDGQASAFMLGMVWGWLPCGMTWSMLAAAAASGDALTGAGMLLAFGLGTLPALLAAGMAGVRLRSALSRVAVRRAAAVMLLAAGTWTAAFPLATGLLRDVPAAAEHRHHH